MNHFEEDIKKYRSELKKAKDGQIKYNKMMKQKQEQLVLVFH